MSFIKTLLRDSVIYTIPAVVSRGLGLILLPLYTHVLSPEQFGIMDMFLTVGNLIALTVALEISQATARYYVEAADDVARNRYVATGFYFTVASYLLFALLAYLMASPITRSLTGSAEYTYHFRLSIAYMVLNGIFIYLQNQLRAELRSKAYTLASFIFSGAWCGTVFWLVYLRGMGLEGILLSMIAGSGSGTLYGFYALHARCMSKASLGTLRQMLAFSAPLVASGVCVFVNVYIDRLMINHFIGLADVGLYGLAFRIAAIAGLSTAGFQGALTPMIMHGYKHAETPHQIARVFSGFAAFALVLYVILALFAEDVLALFVPPSYYAAAPLVSILTLAVLFGNMYIFAPGMTIAKKTHLIFKINLVGAAVNLTLNIAFISSFGALGAALATAIASIVVFGGYVMLGQRYYAIPYATKRIGACVLAAIGIATVNHFYSLGIAAKCACLMVMLLAIWQAQLVRDKKPCVSGS